MLSLNRKILAALMAIGMVVSYSAPAFAQPTESQLNNQLKQQQSELQKNKNALQGLQDKRQDIEDAIEMLDFDIEELMRSIDSTKKKIEQVQNDIKAAEEEIKKTEEEMQIEKDLFNSRMRAMYINGVDGYLNIILESKGFSDFLSRMEDVRRIAEADQKIIAELKAKKEEVDKKKKTLDDKNASLQAMKAENEQKLAKLQKSKDEQAKLIAELKTQEKQYSDEIKASQNRIKEVTDQLDRIRSNPVPTVSSSSGGSGSAAGNSSKGGSSTTGTNASRGGSGISYDSTFGNNVVVLAYKFEGTPYVYGGSSPSGFDCSGFVQYVYKRLGVSLPRTAASQANVGASVSYNNLQPGDLVFFKRGGRPVHHVGIYVGNGCYIHAPQTGDVVKVSDLTRRVGRDYYGARRIR